MVRKRKAIVKPRHKPFLTEYNFEIRVIILFALGIFLIVEELEIKEYIFYFIRIVAKTISNVIASFINGILFLFNKIEGSDLVGITLILYVLYLIANRWRERMIERFSELKNCPSCESKLERIPRKWNHKLISFIYFTKIKNYRCKQCLFSAIKLSNK